MEFLSGFISMETPPKESEGEVLVLLANGDCEIGWAVYSRWLTSEEKEPTFHCMTFRTDDVESPAIGWQRFPKKKVLDPSLSYLDNYVEEVLRVLQVPSNLYVEKLNLEIVPQSFPTLNLQICATGRHSRGPSAMRYPSLKRKYVVIEARKFKNMQYALKQKGFPEVKSEGDYNANPTLIENGN